MKRYLFERSPYRRLNGNIIDNHVGKIVDYAEFSKGGTNLLHVNHRTELVEQYAIVLTLLEHGKILADGYSTQICKLYENTVEI